MFRTLFFLLTFVPWTLFIILTGVPLSLFGSDYLHAYARIWGRVSLWLAGVRLTVAGLENLAQHGPVVYMANHVSNFDILALMAGVPDQFRWMAKIELFRIPLFGLAMRRVGCIPVDRSNRRNSVLSMREAVKRIAAGTSVVIFPEGTRSPDGTLQGFKTGSFTLALQAQVPVVPVAIIGSGEVLPKHSRWIRGGHIRLVIMPPVATSGRAVVERNALMEEVRQPIVEALQQAGQA
ncbi:MAG: acyl-glycerolphosphate acyltransferase [Desulfuromonadales bacterium C00003096]|jgi:1-acyl-sn-glycerol-3-phosphate acyltransferase|nr:MAG: acyl-glycerolphosphate acyltransferase [Desulfuromonadales bacterium C00003096]